LLVALDATYSLENEPTGVGVYSSEILSGVPARHHEHQYLFCYRPHRYLLGRRCERPGSVRPYLLHDRWRVPSRADVFHGLNQRLPERRLKRSVCTFHDLFVMTGEYSSAEFRARFTQQAREAAARSDLIIAVSEFTAGQVAELLRYPRQQVRVIHHGVRALPPTLSPPSRDKIVLHVGGLQRRKNLVRLIGAFGVLPPPWRLVLAGGPGYGAAEVEQSARSSPCASRIDLPGYVSPEQLATLYRTASIFAFPTLDEGFGMPVLEAMSCGLPVIASAGSALPEVCGDAALLVNPLEVDEIAAALVQVASDENVARELTGKGQCRAQEFTWQKAVSATWDVYEEAAGVPSGSAAT
jgi:glycosyltransferase involved in cell wall biosynthesis